MSATGVISWSQTAANNATADSTVNWAEGQAPSSINDSARAVMASVAKYRDDIAGAVVTGGTSTAFTVTSYQGFQSLSQMNGQIIAFTPNATNTGASTLNVDSLGAKPLRSAPSVEIPSGTIIQGTPYLALYNNSDGAFYLHGFYGSPYNIPIGGGIDFWGSTAPNSSFAFPVGQAISRTTYASLFSLVGTTYGTGDGSTTFNLPDTRGRVRAALANLGGSDSGRLTNGSMGGVRNSLGGAGGLDTHTLTAAEIPTITSSNASQSISVGAGGQSIPTSTNPFSGSTSTTGGNPTPISVGGGISGTTSLTGSNSISVTSNNTSGSAHDNLQPTILCAYIMRII